MKNFRGFTLTELMVALAVIGILTAVVTPTIMKIKPNKNKMMIKKAYYTTENIVNSLINNQLYYPDMSDACFDSSLVDETATPKIYCAYGFEYAEPVTDAGITYQGNNKFARLFESKLNIQSGHCDDDTGCTTTDGMTWYLPSWPGKNHNGHQIAVDVNGGTKDPNCSQATEGCSEDDFDTFRINIEPNGKMKIEDTDTKAIEYISINASVSKD